MEDCNNKVYSTDTLLVTDNEIFNIKIYNPEATDFEKQVAYLEGDYYYLYRGELSQKDAKKEPDILPGIYTDPNTKKNFIVEPFTDNDKAKYSYSDKLNSIDPNRIIEMINTKEKVLVTIPESSKLFLPSLNNNDDILKRLVKTALIKKNIDIDQYRHRFVDKNALFNFKQVVKGQNKLSMLLFDRGCEALNLKYTIIIEEANPDDVIGNPLDDKLIASSTDTYEL